MPLELFIPVRNCFERWRCFRRNLIVCGLCLMPVANSSVALGREAQRPNIVIFVADDLGWGDLACYGHPVIRTPNLDRFAAEGVRFTQAYSASGVCSPSRSAILTGRTPYRNGVYRWIPVFSPRFGNLPVHLRSSEITIARLLKEHGYATGIVGKWHLNGAFNSPEQPQPDDHGFDHWMATQNNAVPSHKNPNNFVRNGEPVGELTGYSAFLVAEEAAKLIAERDPTKPLFLCVWTHEAHVPIESDPKLMKGYAGTGDAGMMQYYGNVSQLDQAFGRVMQALDQSGLRENTLVFFTSDNGPEGTGGPNALRPRLDRSRGSTGGLRGRKRDDYEGGIRVPGIVRWPGHIAPGSVSDVPVVGTDIFSTICEVTGIPPPADRVIDGASMLPAFAGQPIQRSRPLYWRTSIATASCRVALRIGDWKIVANENLTEFELYDLATNPVEGLDLKDREPAKFAELKQALITMDTEVLNDGPGWWKDDRGTVQ